MNRVPLAAVLAAAFFCAPPASARLLSQYHNELVLVVDDRSRCADHYVEELETLFKDQRVARFFGQEFAGRKMRLVLRVASQANERRSKHNWENLERLRGSRPYLCDEDGVVLKIHFFQDGSHWGGYPLTEELKADSLEQLVKDVFAKRVKL